MEGAAAIPREAIEPSLRPAQERFSILLVDNDPIVVRVLNRILHEFAPIRFANSGREALKLAREFAPDLVLLDVNMPEMGGFEVCKAFKLDPELARVPIIFITSHENAELQAKALQLGAADFISKPPQGPVVLARVRTFQRMKMLSDTLQNAATMDFLTGAVTRHQLERSLRQQWRRALGCAAPLALLLADIDDFTAYNAEFDEDSGDACLRSVAEALRSVAHRPADILGRYGGGRFAILLPETDAGAARAIAQSALEAVGALKLEHAASSAPSRITLSVGGACRDFARSIVRNAGASNSVRRPLVDYVPEDLIGTAERALKSAKSAGEHCARIVDMPDTELASASLTCQ
jgi:diguanylate cyclase (GGDEF)-like protein